MLKIIWKILIIHFFIKFSLSFFSMVFYINTDIHFDDYQYFNIKAQNANHSYQDVGHSKLIKNSKCEFD